ncbi:rod shape-determining protein MreB and related proteins [Ardenticatena maritima]|uniref:Cell shape-determining protein MreB n=1 Tax=Ardenticatena maritima TaxID=872965 RepID=A0A0M8K755_9CHLR|nr:rod shape-determining protein [Ardenticatena maritima]GAP61706.1 rod shape-determining protein MreB and related proteins [Ardenticatena maritima]
MISPLSKLFGLFSRDIAMDLGTANTVVAVRGQGIVINEPSVVAVDKRNGRVLAVGADAKEMVGRTPAHIVAVRPLRDGVISDFDVTHAMISEFIKKVHERTILPVSPRIVIGIPGGVTEVERIAVRDAALSAGAREVHLIEQPMAAAIGAGLPVTESVGSMVVDIGGGTTEIAVISMGGIVVNNSIRIAGDELDEAIIDYARQRYNLLIGPRMAERVKVQIGSAYPLEDEMTMEIRGRNLITGLPEAVTVTSIEIREAISGPVGAIVEATRAAIDQTPPELVADLMENGIALAGGGALLKGLAQRLTDETRMRVYVADDPLSCVVRGCAHALERPDLLKQVQAPPHRPVTPH